MRRNAIPYRPVAFVLLLLASSWGLADSQVDKHLPKDSVTLSTPTWSELPSSKMARSTYPVKLTVKGRSLRVTSKYEQVLPIYTQTGSLYIAMQLSPGINWLNGLPRGRYRINNRTVSIK